MLPARPLPLLSLVLRVLLGAWFVYSGGEKVFGTGLGEFTRGVANYRIVGAPWDALVAYTLPWFEMTAGLCLVLGYLRKGALLTVAGMTAVFTFAVGHAWKTGLNIACGCRGSSEAMNPTWKMVEFAAYFTVIAFVWWQECRTVKKASH